MPSDSNASASSMPWYRRVGPGLITACVVIGPGSILTSSKVGANQGYSMLSIVLVSVIFMMVFMTMGARLGAVANVSPLELVRRKAGRWVAILLGWIVFFISAAFQSGNNIGVAAAFESFLPEEHQWAVALLVIGFNLIAITFLFAFKNLYRVIERLMMGFVALMLISFAINLISLKPDPVAMAKGFIPAIESLDLAVLGLIGTTFVITAAFYQAYLVQQKGWTREQLRIGMMDARIGSIIMALITIMLMSTAAAGLYTGGEVTLADPVAVAESLEPTFGTRGKIIFCLGLFSAAYSSFLVNSMIGGFVVADGMQLGSDPHDRWPRIMTTVALLTGMGIAIAIVMMGFDHTPMIIAAQAVTVVGAPLVAGILLWLTNSPDVMGDQVNGKVTRVLATIGFVLLLAIAARTASLLPAKIQQYRNPSSANHDSSWIQSTMLHCSFRNRHDGSRWC